MAIRRLVPMMALALGACGSGSSSTPTSPSTVSPSSAASTTTQASVDTTSTTTTPDLVPTSTSPYPILTVAEALRGGLLNRRFDFIGEDGYAGPIPDDAALAGFPEQSSVLGTRPVNDPAVATVVDLSLSTETPGYHGQHILLSAIAGERNASGRVVWRFVDQVVVDLNDSEFVSIQLSEGCRSEAPVDGTIIAILDPGPDYPAKSGDATVHKAWSFDTTGKITPIATEGITCPLINA